MKKYFSLLILMVFFAANAQVTANRFFYELTYKPKKDSAKTEKVMFALDVAPEKSLFRDYTMIAQDSLMKVKVEEMQKAGVFKDMSNSITWPKFTYRVIKTYPTMETQYAEAISSGFTPVNLAYNETPVFNWKIGSETMKIGEYNTQKATTTFGGRMWTAWFSKDLPMQDGPYKFSGLPGLIVKIEDTDKNYSFELKGNRPIKDWSEYTYLEKMQSGGSPKTVEVDRSKFESKFSEYKNDPFGSMRSQMTPEIMSTKLPGSDKTVGDMVKDGEKRIKKLYGAIDNPIELVKPDSKKK